MHIGRLTLVVGLVVAQSSSVVSRGETAIHEAGRCAIRGHCGKKSFFGGELPCPDNGLAESLEKNVREKLVTLCGNKWQKGPVCCQDVQVRLAGSASLL
jgi:Niemann-Pick C1 protein